MDDGTLEKMEQREKEIKTRALVSDLREVFGTERLHDITALINVLSHGLNMASSGYDMIGLMDITGIPIEDDYADNYIAMMHQGDARADRIWLFAKALHVVSDKLCDVITESFPDLKLDRLFGQLNDMIEKINEKRLEHQDKIAKAKEKLENGI